MKQYFFILGREPELSVTEIWQVAIFSNIKLAMVHVDKQFLIVNCQNLDVNWWQERLGGVIKIGEIVGEWEIDKDIMSEQIIKNIKPTKQIFFGFSWHGQAPRWMNALGLEVKKKLKGQGKVRYVVSRDQVLSSVAVQKNHLLPPTGYDFVFMPQISKIVVGITLSVQPFAEFSNRDFGRPARDSYVGMLPPKLARMMVNISLSGGNLLDPFCGSGTILQEAALLGVKNMTGSDSSVGGSTRTKENIKWLRTKNPNLDFSYNIYHSPLESLSDFVKEKFSSIVCEPFLGRPLSGRESQKEVADMINELTFNYRRWLKILTRFLHNNGKLVMVWPVVVKGSDFLYLPLENSLSEAGLKISNIIPEFVPKNWLSIRGTLFYHRPGQKIAREIVALRRQ